MLFVFAVVVVRLVVVVVLDELLPFELVRLPELDRDEELLLDDPPVVVVPSG